MRFLAALAFVACAVLAQPALGARVDANELALSLARGATARPVPSQPPLDAASVLARYRTALAHLHRPRALSFEFALAQLGLHDMEQTHQVYRSGASERDETLVVDGYRLKAPAVRIITGRSPHYDIAAVAPRAQTYRFIPVAAVRGSGDYQYVFRTEPRAPRAFAIGEIEVDGRTFLPTIVRFITSGNGARGNGELIYGAVDGYWVIRKATIAATLRDGTHARERIEWSKYQFPPQLPPDTFRVPRAQPIPLLAPELAPAAPVAP